MTVTTPSVSIRTYPLALGTLAVGTSGYSVASLLPAMSAHLRTSPSTIGQLITVFALTCAVAGPPIAVATRHWERRRLLVIALMVTGLGNALAALAPSFPVLVAARIITALGTPVFTAGAAAMAAEINGSSRHARAMAVVFGGLTVALLLGVPTINALVEPLGYRAVFWLVAALCIVGAIGVAVSVPMVDAPAVASLRERLAAAGDRRVLAVLAVALLAPTSTFAVYTYVSPLLADVASTRGSAITVLLAAYGAGAVMGNLAGGRATDRYGSRPVLLAATAACTVLLAVLPFAAGTPVAASVTLAAWGCAFWSINPAVNSLLVRLSPTQAALLTSLNGSVVYLGVGLGGLLGGLVVGWVGVNALAPVAAAVAAAACAVLLLASRRTPSQVARFTDAEELMADRALNNQG